VVVVVWTVKRGGQLPDFFSHDLYITYVRFIFGILEKGLAFWKLLGACFAMEI